MDHYVSKYGRSRIYGHPNEFYDLIRSKLNDIEMSDRKIDESYNRCFDNFKISKIKQFSKILGIMQEINEMGEGYCELKIDGKSYSKYSEIPADLKIVT